MFKYFYTSIEQVSNTNLERLQKKKRQIPRSLQLLFVSLNFGALYAVFNQMTFFWIFLLGIGIMLLLFLKSLIKNGVSKQMSNYSPWLMRKYSKMTRKYIIAGSIGLFLSILVISQAFILPDSISQTLIKNEIRDLNSTGLEINQFYGKYDTYVESPIVSTDNIVRKSVDKYQLVITESSNYTISNVYSFTYKNGNTTSLSQRTLTIIPLSMEIFNRMSPFLDVNLNYSDNANITVSMSDLALPSNIDTIEVSSFDNQGTTAKNVTIPIQSNLQLERGQMENILGELIQHFFISNYILFINSEIFSKLVPDLIQADASYEIYIEYNFQLPDFNQVTPSEFLDKLLNLVSDLYVELPNGQPSSPLAQSLLGISFTLEAFRIISTLLSLPVMGLALFLIYFSVNLVRKRKEKLMTITKIRGINEVQIGSMLMFELVISSAISIVVGMLLSLPYLITLKSSLQFLQHKSFLIDQFIISPSWYWQVPLLGAILSFDLNIGNIFSLMKLTIDEGAITEETKKPFIQRFNIDLIIFAIGILQYILIETLKLVPLPAIFLILIYTTVPFGVLGFLIGTTLIVERFFHIYAGWTSDFLWIKRGDMLALATRNLRKSKFSASKLAAILVFGIVVSGLFITLPPSFTQTINQTQEYRMGAPGTTTLTGKMNYTSALNVTDTIQTITGVKHTSLVLSTQIFGNGNFVGIDLATIADALFWKDSFASDPLRDLISPLKDNGTFLTSRFMEKSKGYTLGSNVSFVLGNEGVQLQVAGFFNYFPMAKLQEDDASDYQTPIVMNSKYFYSLFESSGSVQYRILMSFTEDANMTYISDQIGKIDNSSFEYITSIDEASNAQFQLLNTLSASFVVISLLVSFVAVGYYSFISLSDRSKEIGIYRALGMVSNQIFKLLVIESIFILLSSMFFGITMTVLILRYFLGLMTLSVGSSSIVIIIYSFPIGYYLFIASLLIVALIAVIIPTVKLSRLETGSILRGD